MRVKVTETHNVIEEYAEDNYYAMLDYLSFHCSRKTQFNVNY